MRKKVSVMLTAEAFNEWEPLSCVFFKLIDLVRIDDVAEIASDHLCQVLELTIAEINHGLSGAAYPRWAWRLVRLLCAHLSVK